MDGLKKKLPKIADSEWRIMKLLWQKAPQSANQIIDKLKNEIDWKPRTIKTLLNRLVTKGALDFKTEGRSYLYSPAVTESECKRNAAHSFVNRVFDGTLKPMLAAFLESGQLSKNDLEELKQILDKEE
jgi:BlaI family penicillinase repressor